MKKKSTSRNIWIHVIIKLYILDWRHLHNFELHFTAHLNLHTIVLNFVIHKWMFHKQCVECYWYDETGERCPVTIQRWRCANGVNMAEKRTTTHYQIINEIINEGFCWQLSKGNLLFFANFKGVHVLSSLLKQAVMGFFTH